jgi:diguanylate cyclase (GGDEF)-like protein
MDLHDEAALDEALAESFPASDPVAVSIDPRPLPLAEPKYPSGRGRHAHAALDMDELHQVLELAGNMLELHQLHNAIAVIGASAPTLRADEVFVKVSKDNETCEARFDRTGQPVAFDENAAALQQALRGPGARKSGASIVEHIDPHGYIVVHWNRRQSAKAMNRARPVIEAFAVLTRAFLAGMDDSAVREARLCRRETAQVDSDQRATQRLRASEARAAEAQELAARDVLTGLQNRRGFFLKAEERFLMAKKQDLACAVIFADVDGLKAVNDQHGHEVGDDLIRDAATIFRQAFRAADVVARLGGDEFVAFTIDDSDPETILVRLQALIQGFNNAGGHPYRLSLSTGVAACAPSTSATLANYLQLADAEMYKRKRRVLGA